MISYQHCPRTMIVLHREGPGAEPFDAVEKHQTCLDYWNYSEERRQGISCTLDSVHRNIHHVIVLSLYCYKISKCQWLIVSSVHCPLSSVHSPLHSNPCWHSVSNTPWVDCREMFPRFIIWLKRSRFITTEHCPTGLVFTTQVRWERGGGRVLFILQKLTHAQGGVGWPDSWWWAVSVSAWCSQAPGYPLTSHQPVLSPSPLSLCANLSLSQNMRIKCPTKWSEVRCRVCFHGWRLSQYTVQCEGYWTFL